MYEPVVGWRPRNELVLGAHLSDERLWEKRFEAYFFLCEICFGNYNKDGFIPKPSPPEWTGGQVNAGRQPLPQRLARVIGIRDRLDDIPSLS